MAVPTNAQQTFQQIGIREDLHDVITNLAPTETPFFSMIRKGKAKNRSPEWLEDTLATVDPTNANVEGDDAANDAALAPTRMKNYVQLFDKVVQVSSTAQVVDTAGRTNELNYQLAKRGKEIKRDMEARFCGNYASVAGNASTAGQCAGFEAFITTNDSRGVAGADGGYNSGTGLTAAATDGTQRAFTESLLKGVIRTAWAAGGEPDTIILGPTNKQNFSAFAGVATQYRENSGTGMATITASAGIYVSDFGQFKAVPSRFSRDRSALVVQPDVWSVLWLQPVQRTALAKTGHSDRSMLFCEATLKCATEKANAIVADLT